jgi:gliding motility-associated-like protein
MKKSLLCLATAILFSGVSMAQVNQSTTNHTPSNQTTKPQIKRLPATSGNDYIKAGPVKPMPKATSGIGKKSATNVFSGNGFSLSGTTKSGSNALTNQLIIDGKKSAPAGSNTTIDTRNLPLDQNGNLLSVDGFPVEFKVPSKKEISNVCFTPRPYITGAPKDAACGFSVPCDNPANRDAADVVTIDYFQVEWHVMMDGGPSSNISQATIDALMAELNADYAPHNMIFCADPATFTEDAVNYTHDENTEEVSLKTAYNVTPTQVINVYVVGAMGPGGYARFPYDPMGGTSATGGIVLNRGNCSVGTHTLAHEMGHTFGLAHTFAGVDERPQCSNCYEKVRNVNGSSNTTGVPTPLGGPYAQEGDQEGDWCSDTNPHDTYTYQCSTSGNPNGACDSNPWNNAPVSNHMSYSFCSSQFSTQQGYRMHCMTDSYLGSWIAYGGGICGSQPPTADFVGTPTTWQAPSNVTFTDLSQPAALVTGWTWNFDVGASGTVTCVGCVGPTATFVGQTPPVVNYPNPGLYTVSLDITSANGPDNETKVDYIEVLAPAGDCDTLTLYWDNPSPPTPSWYWYAAIGEGYLTGVPDPQNSSNFPAFPATPDPKGMYERYFTPNPGVSQVGAIRVGLGNLNDTDGDMRFQVTVYDDDGAGAPGAFLGGRGNIDPTALGVPGYGFYAEYWIPLFVAQTPTTGTFHVAVEIFPGPDLGVGGDNTDSLVVISSVHTEGQANYLNHIFSTGWGYENIGAVYGGLDIDLDIVPMLGEWAPDPLITGFTETVVCDTTYVTIYDTILYTAFPTAIGFEFSDGTVLNYTADPVSIDLTYTSPGPDTIMVYAVNECGRADTNLYIIPYNFLSTPDAEFTKNPQNPICAGAPGVTFTANTSGYDDYLWDFGDGSPPVSTGGVPTANYIYPTPGLYYASLTTTTAGFAPMDTFYLEDFESGWPAGYDRYNNDAGTPQAPQVNPPFTGTDATAWLPIDFTGNGNTDAMSTSWNSNPTIAADDWMLTTGIGVLPAGQRLYWDAEAIDNVFSDGYEVRISTVQLPANVGNYSTLLYSTVAENSFRTTHGVDLSAYAGQTVFIAFVNNSLDDYLLSIDNIRVGTAAPGCDATVTKPDFVEIVDCTVIPPTAVLGAVPITGCAPLNVTFSDNTVAGDPATTWLWNFGDATFSSLQNPPVHVYTTPGTYFVSFQSCNAGGCTTDFTTITVGTPPTISGTVDVNPSCTANDGSITVTATGGTTPYQYSNDNGVTFQAGNAFTGLGAGSYDIVVSDALGCTATVNVVLSTPAAPTISNVATTDPTCGNNNGQIVITAAGGQTPYQYSIDNGVTFQASNTFGSLGTGTYDIVVEDNNGCTVSTQVTLTDPGPPTISNVAVTDPTCGNNNGQIVITAAGGTPPLQYSIDNGVTFQASNTFGSLGTGTYDIVVEDAAGCTVGTQVTLTDPGAPTISNVATTDPTCGNNNGQIVITAAGGTPPLQYSIDNGVTFQASNTFGSLGTGTYDIVVEDAAGCTVGTQVTLTDPGPPTISNVAVTDPTCGNNNGQIVITAAGGTPPLQYSIDNGVTFQASNTFGSLGTGTYDIVVEDAAGCTVGTQVTLTDPGAPTISNVATTDPTCGNTNGDITITAGGGTPPLQYSIDNGVTFQAGNNFAGLGAGTYDIVVEDAAGCTASTQVTLTDIGGATISNVATTDPTCNGGSDGDITITATGGTSPLQYSIDNGVTFQAGNNFTGLPAGTYDIVVEDGTGCQTTTQVTLTDPPAVAWTAVITDENCGAGDGQIVLTGSGGDGGPYTYSIDNGVTFQASGTFGSLSAGSYNVVVMDASGCTTAAIETVGGTGGATITGFTEDISLLCNGDCSGQITVNVTGGTTPYSYSWETSAPAPIGGNSATLGPVCADTYTVTVTDAGGGPSVPFWTEDFGLDAACANQNQLATVAPSANGSWTQSILAAEGGVPNQWFVSATEAFTGTGNCGDGCLGNPALDNQTLHVGSLGVGLCPSGDCGAAYNAGGSGETHKRIESPTIDCSGESTITLAFDYMHFGETGTDAASLAYFDGVTWTNLVAPLPQGACCGGPCGSLFVQGQWAPTQYSIVLPASADGNANVQIGFVWDNDANNSGADPSFAVDNITLTSAAGGGGCPAVASFTLTEPAAVTFTTTVTDENCGLGDGQIVVNGAAGGDGGPYQFSIDNGVTFQGSNTFSGLGAATYDIVVEDGNGCQGTASVTVNNVGGPTISNVAVTDPTCGNNNGDITITATGGTTPYQYSIDNGVTFQAGNNFAGLGTGTYDIVVEDASGCQSTTQVTLTDPGAPTISNVAVTNPTCGNNNGDITITASGGTTPLQYSIDNGVTFQAGNNFGSLGTGTYDIVVEDAAGCTASTQVTLTDPGAPTISNVATTDPTCGNPDGDITITASGGTPPLQYSIDNGVTFQAGNSFTGLGAGTYDIVVEDAAGCTVATQVTLTDQGGATISNITATDPQCAGDSNGSIVVTATGGQTPYQYSNDNGVTFQGSDTFSGLPAGTYDIVVEDNNGCQTTQQVILTDPAPVSIDNVATVDPSCIANDGSITITASGGDGGPYNFSIDNGVTFQASNAFTNLGVGTYDIVVTDGNGCSATTQVSLVNPGAPTIDNVTTVDPSCAANDGSITITASGGQTPYQYSIDNGVTFQAGNAFTNLGVGTYDIVVVDNNGCSSTTQVILTNPGGPSISNITAVDPTCNGATDGSIDITVTGGQTPYQYSIDNGVTFQAGNSFTGLGAGTYDIVVEDNNGCQVTQQVILTDPPAVSIDNVVTTDPSCGNTDGDITITASGGDGGPYQFSIDNGVTFQGSNAFTSLGAGTFDIVVTDGNGCSATAQTTLTNTGGPTFTIVQTDPLCNGGTDGSITITASGGSSPYQYSIDGGTTFLPSNTFNVSAGSYDVMVEDAGGCQSTITTVVITEPAPVTLTMSAAVSICEGDNTVISATAGGGTSPYTYTWICDQPNCNLSSSTDPNPTATPTVSTWYYAQAVDGNGCTSLVDSVLVTVDPLPNVSAGLDVTIILGDQTQLNATPSGAASYVWTPSTGLDNPAIENPWASPVVTTTYSVIVTTAAGCSASDDVVVTVEDGEVTVPTGFTPDGDGTNDTWNIQNVTQYPDITVEIFNRWGNQIFESKGYTTPWDGTYNGNLLPTGSYYFLINLNDGESEPITGTVTVIR